MDGHHGNRSPGWGLGCQPQAYRIVLQDRTLPNRPGSRGVLHGGVYPRIARTRNTVEPSCNGLGGGISTSAEEYDVLYFTGFRREAWKVGQIWYTIGGCKRNEVGPICLAIWNGPIKRADNLQQDRSLRFQVDSQTCCSFLGHALDTSWFVLSASPLDLG